MAPPQDLAEARSRLLQLAQVARELVKTIDVELAAHLDGGALRYGDSLLRPAGRGRPRIVDKTLWWDMVTEGVLKSDNPAGLLSSLYPADSVRLTALQQLAQVLDVPETSIRETMIDYDEPTALLSVMPMSRAPKWALALKDGQLSNVRVPAEPKSLEEIQATVARKIDEARDRAVAILRDEIEDGALDD